MKKKIKLNRNDRILLYNRLLEDSGLKENVDRKKKEVSKFIIYLYKNYIIPEEELRIFEGSKNIISTNCYVRIKYSDIWPEMKDNVYPCGDLYRLDFVEGKNRYAIVDFSFNIYAVNDLDLNLIIPSIEDYLWVSQDYIISKIPEKELETLKNLLIQYFDTKYDVVNFLIDYINGTEFIGNINTLSQLNYFNNEWARKLEEILKDRENKLKDIEEQNKVVEFPKSDISTCLNNLKEILEGRNLLKEMPRLL